MHNDLFAIPDLDIICHDDIWLRKKDIETWQREFEIILHIYAEEIGIPAVLLGNAKAPTCRDLFAASRDGDLEQIAGDRVQIRDFTAGIAAKKMKNREIASVKDTLEDAPQDVIAQYILPKKNTKELSLLLTNDTQMRDLNKQYRKQDKSTNVLAFPSVIDLSLGDIVLSFDTIEKEAFEQDKNFDYHVWHLFLHGYLHLLGFDHIEEEERITMEAKEIEVLKKIGVSNPYA